MGPWTLSIDQKPKRNPLGQRSPGSSVQYDINRTPSPSSTSQKSPLSRQGTVRASHHRRKNSMSQSLNLSGRRSPQPLLQDRSPQGRRSPNFLMHEQMRNQMGLSLNDDRRSPTGRRSPLGMPPNINASSSPTERRSPVATQMSFSNWDRQKSPTSSIHIQDRKSPMTLGGFPQAFYSDQRKSPLGQMQIPPITISNPSETCGLSPKSLKSSESGKVSPATKVLTPTTPSKEHSDNDKKGSLSNLAKEAKDRDKSGSPSPTPEKKEKTSVMKEILAFVRKPSKKMSTRSRFAAAFSRADSTSGPLLRQSTFSSIPNSSSRSGRNAVTKQMSEVGYESKVSKLKNVGSKMSLRLRRAADIKLRDKKSSGDEISDLESSDGGKLEPHTFKKGLYECAASGSGSDPFEMDTVHFEKVGHVPKKHEQIVEEDSPVQYENIGEALANKCSGNELERPRNLYEELKRSIETLFENKEPIYENIEEFQKRDSEEKDPDKDGMPKSAIQCPTFEIEPPSRRASFDPPRSPFLENFRSLSDTDHEIPSGESFEIVDTDRHRESSFEDRYSSMSTSFDISRYQSTSYEDQTSSFELVETQLSDSQTQPQQQTLTPQFKEENKMKTSSIDLSKSSIEIMDPETFHQRATPTDRDRKSSLETHFDLSDSYRTDTPVRSAFATCKSHECFPIGMRAHYQAIAHHQPSTSHHRARSPLSNQTSSNYSSRDSYDSSTYESMPHPHPPHLFDSKSPFADPSKHHYPLPRKYSNDKTFLCIDKRCAAIFEPRSQSPQVNASVVSANNYLNTTDTSSGSEFEAPSPRRALSASPKHTFTFRIVMKKVESSPDDLCCSTDRPIYKHRDPRDRHRRDSRRCRKPRLGSNVAGKSF